MVIEILARKTAHPLISEDALPWCEFPSLENALMFGIFCPLVPMYRPLFHSSNGTSTAIWNFDSFFCGNEPFDSTDFEVLEDEDQVLKAKMIAFEVKL